VGRPLPLSSGRPSPILELVSPLQYPRCVKKSRLAGLELDTYLELIRNALVEAFRPQQVILFGSFARGDQNRASDLDVVVIAPTSLSFEERIGRALEACYSVSTRLPVEVLVYTPGEWQTMRGAGRSFPSLVEREGRVLYERESQPDGKRALAAAGAS
jgi:predicted nucleotidyltransferase